MLRCPSISDGRLSYQFSSDGYIRRSVYAYGSRTIIEKFEAESGDVSFAIVLMTPDDSGSALASESTRLRARQNVLYELGYFAGKLGRGKVLVLRKGDIEIPSDLAGVLYTELDEHGGWKRKLLSELAYAGVPFDKDKALSA
ncbi:nucleotide-binding protein [Escherichia coli]|uniref:nucleotide-binding protein n=1 Tax=Escherichia coli TaxID=562 RepID=UPI00288A12E4|nr:nucleotide-binding protein [Escherichia coli]